MEKTMPIGLEILICVFAVYSVIWAINTITGNY